MNSNKTIKSNNGEVIAYISADSFFGHVPQSNSLHQLERVSLNGSSQDGLHDEYGGQFQQFQSVQVIGNAGEAEDASSLVVESIPKQRISKKRKRSASSKITTHSSKKALKSFVANQDDSINLFNQQQLFQKSGSGAISQSQNVIYPPLSHHNSMNQMGTYIMPQSSGKAPVRSTQKKKRQAYGGSASSGNFSQETGDPLMGFSVSQDKIQSTIENIEACNQNSRYHSNQNQDEEVPGQVYPLFLSLDPVQDQLELPEASDIETSKFQQNHAGFNKQDTPAKHQLVEESLERGSDSRSLQRSIQSNLKTIEINQPGHRRTQQQHQHHQQLSSIGGTEGNYLIRSLGNSSDNAVADMETQPPPELLRQSHSIQTSFEPSLERLDRKPRSSLGSQGSDWAMKVDMKKFLKEWNGKFQNSKINKNNKSYNNNLKKQKKRKSSNHPPKKHSKLRKSDHQQMMHFDAYQNSKIILAGSGHPGHQQKNQAMGARSSSHQLGQNPGARSQSGNIVLIQQKQKKTAKNLQGSIDTSGQSQSMLAQHGPINVGKSLNVNALSNGQLFHQGISKSGKVGYKNPQSSDQQQYQQNLRQNWLNQSYDGNNAHLLQLQQNSYGGQQKVSLLQGQSHGNIGQPQYSHGNNSMVLQPQLGNNSKPTNSTKLKNIYSNQSFMQIGGTSSTTNQKSGGAMNQHQKKMMMKNQNQLRNSYNSVTSGLTGATVGAPAGKGNNFPGQAADVGVRVSSQQSNKQMLQQAQGPATKKNIMMVYSTKSGQKMPSKERYANNSTNADYLANPNQLQMNLQTIQQPIGQHGKGNGKSEILSQSLSNVGANNYNTISHGTKAGTAVKQFSGDGHPAKESTKRSGTTGGTCSGMNATPGGGGPLQQPNNNVYTSNEERRAGANSRQLNRIPKNQQNISSIHSQKHISMQKIDQLRGSQSTVVGDQNSLIYGGQQAPLQYSDAGKNSGIKNSRRRLTGGQNVAHSTSKVGLKSSIAQSSASQQDQMPDITQKNSTSSGRFEKLQNQRASIKKDSEHQTITLIPSHKMGSAEGFVSLSNSIDVDLQNPNLQSIEYTNQGAVKGGRPFLPSGNAKERGQSANNRYSGKRGQSGRSVHSKSGGHVSASNRAGSRQASREKRSQYSNHGAAEKEDLVNFSPSNIEIGNPDFQGDRRGGFSKLTHKFTGDLVARMQAQLNDQQQTYQSQVEDLAKARARNKDELEKKLKGQKPSYDQQKETEKLGFKETAKEIQYATDNSQGQLAIYAGILNEIASQDDRLQGVLSQVAEGLSGIISVQEKETKEKQQKMLEKMHAQADEFHRRYNNVKQRNESSDKVMSEMKKQLICYKEDIENMKKMEAHLTVENYQKLVNDFNQLYDHYKMHKVMSKKLKVELSQSNHRERTFLKLLKKTSEFGEQAAQLEKEYDKLYENGEQQFNLSNEQKFIEVSNNIQIPMLDLSIIHIQQQEDGAEGDTTTTNQDEMQNLAAGAEDTPGNLHDIAQNDISVIEHSEANSALGADNKELQDALKNMAAAGDESSEYVFSGKKVDAKNLKLSGILNDTDEVQGDTDDGKKQQAMKAGKK